MDHHLAISRMTAEGYDALPPPRQALLRDFLSNHLTATGAFAGRGGHPDVYYTWFGIECLLATRMSEPLDRVRGFVADALTRTEHDLVHRCCLLRSAARLGLPCPEAHLRALETHRTSDGGYTRRPGREAASLYALFMTHLAYAEWDRHPPDPDATQAWVMRALVDPASGRLTSGFMREPTPLLAAGALAIEREPTRDRQLAEALSRRCSPQSGGIHAVAGLPLPELISTATGLYALHVLRASPHGLAPAAIEAWVLSLTARAGGFRGHSLDPIADTEYSFYGLLALGASGQVRAPDFSAG